MWYYIVCQDEPDEVFKYPRHLHGQALCVYYYYLYVFVERTE